MTNEQKKARLVAVSETLNRHPGYDPDWLVKELREIDASDSFLAEAIDHILGANGRGAYRKADVVNNIVWAKAKIRNYIDERLDP